MFTTRKYRRLLQSALIALIGFGLTWLLTLLPSLNERAIAVFPISKTTAQIQSEQRSADKLTQLGWQQFHQGDVTAALQTWQDATRKYRQAKDETGTVGSLVNESLALRSLGFYPRACSTILNALNLSQNLCPPIGIASSAAIPEVLAQLKQQPVTQVRILALRSLGTTLRQIGNLAASEAILNQALSSAQTAAKQDIPSLLLSLAITEQAQVKQAQVRYDLAEDYDRELIELETIETNLKNAIAHYQQAASTSKATSNIQLQSALNLLRLSRDVDQWLTIYQAFATPGLQTLRKNLISQRPQLIEKIESTSLEPLPVVEVIQAQLHYSETLLQFLSTPNLMSGLSTSSKIAGTIRDRAQTALKQAQTIRDRRHQSLALGILARLDYQTNQFQSAQSTATQALSLSQSISAWDLSYQWRYLLAQLAQKQRNSAKAIENYRAAIVNLNQVREALSGGNLDLQLSFRDKIEPVYREYLQLLLNQSNPDLKAAIAINNQLQITELENFLRCGKLDLVPLSQISTSKSETIIYVLKLLDRYEVIVQSANRSLQHFPIGARSLQDNVNNLLRVLQNEEFSQLAEGEFLPDAQRLYRLLIAPIKRALPNQGTLVFVLDSTLQNIPMSLLHDGESYLIERYSVSTIPGAQMRSPQPIGNKQLRALIAGLSQRSPSLNAPGSPPRLLPLPQVKEEVEQIRQSIPNSVVLLDRAFTSRQFQQALQQERLPILHISTHGRYSSIPENTVLLAWDRPLNLPQLNQTLRSLSESGQPNLELLVLSACETARGDRRSTLGLAGIATQAGARSTIASLWLVDSQSTAELMRIFYQALSKGQSKAEALRTAQLTLLSTSTYRHPYFWSSFLLIGSWL
ncbi:CHAT domain-containing protein [Leptolyngbya sp. AN03gr2]|uniref:CHAT domain-containing protein n=1 Tax=unclassified Leptolyngbya TaxID=2650499 RepID=UPI003D30F585